MRHLFDRAAEDVGQLLQIMPRIARRLLEGAIGKQGGPGEIVGQPDLCDIPRFRRLEPGKVQGRLQQTVLAEKRDLVQHLEPLCRAMRARRN